MQEKRFLQQNWLLSPASCNKACPSLSHGASLVAQMVKNLPEMQETRVQSLGWEDPLEKGMLPTPVFLPEEFHRQRSLIGYSLWVA